MPVTPPGVPLATSLLEAPAVPTRPSASHLEALTPSPRQRSLPSPTFHPDRQTCGGQCPAVSCSESVLRRAGGPYPSPSQAVMGRRQGPELEPAEGGACGEAFSGHPHAWICPQGLARCLLDTFASPCSSGCCCLPHVCCGKGDHAERCHSALFVRAPGGGAWKSERTAASVDCGF